jgi:hypothetical protein
VQDVEDENQRAKPTEVLERLRDGGSKPYILFREHKWEVCDPFEGTDKANATTLNLRPARYSLSHPALLSGAHRSWRKHYVHAKLVVKKGGKDLVLWRTFWLGPDGTPEYIPDTAEKKKEEKKSEQEKKKTEKKEKIEQKKEDRENRREDRREDRRDNSTSTSTASTTTR